MEIEGRFPHRAAGRAARPRLVAPRVALLPDVLRPHAHAHRAREGRARRSRSARCGPPRGAGPASLGCVSPSPRRRAAACWSRDAVGHRGVGDPGAAIGAWGVVGRATRRRARRRVRAEAAHAALREGSADAFVSTRCDDGEVVDGRRGDATRVRRARRRTSLARGGLVFLYVLKAPLPYGQWSPRPRSSTLTPAPSEVFGVDRRSHISMQGWSDGRPFSECLRWFCYDDGPHAAHAEKNGVIRFERCCHNNAIMARLAAEAFRACTPSLDPSLYYASVFAPGSTAREALETALEGSVSCHEPTSSSTS